MPRDTARAEQRIQAPVADVLATLHDVAAQAEWIPEVTEVRVLDVDAGGRVRRADVAAATAVGTDRYTLVFTHRPDGVGWTLESGRLQSAQDGDLRAVPATDDDGVTLVTYELTIEHPLPLPGFVRSRVIRGLVTGTLAGLRDRLERG